MNRCDNFSFFKTLQLISLDCLILFVHGCGWEAFDGFIDLGSIGFALLSK